MDKPYLFQIEFIGQEMQLSSCEMFTDIHWSNITIILICQTNFTILPQP